jgi:hypothetical protein
MGIQQIRSRRGVFNKLTNKQAGVLNIPTNANVNGGRSLFFGANTSDRVVVQTYEIPATVGDAGKVLESDGTNAVFVAPQKDFAVQVASASTTLTTDTAFISLPAANAGQLINKMTFSTFTSTGTYDVEVTDLEANVLYSDTLSEGTSTIDLASPYTIVGNENLTIAITNVTGTISGLQAIAHVTNQ